MKEAFERRHQKESGHTMIKALKHVACGKSINQTIKHPMIKAFETRELKYSEAKGIHKVTTLGQ